MKAKKYILIGMFFFILVLFLFVMYHGKKEEYYITLKGVVLSVENASLIIQGDPQNDAGQRGQYIVKNIDSISVRNSSGDSISFAMLSVGDHVEIQYMDYIARSKVEQYGLDDGAEVPKVQQIDVIE